VAVHVCNPSTPEAEAARPACATNRDSESNSVSRNDHPVSTDPSTSLRSWNPVGSCSFLSLPNLPPQECTFCFASWQPSLLGLPAVSPKDCPSRAGSMAQVIENLPSKCKALSSSPPTKTPKKVHLHFAKRAPAESTL
jgi:hypothetical protein